MRGLRTRIGPSTFPGFSSPCVLLRVTMMVAPLLRRCMAPSLLFLGSFWAVLSRLWNHFCAPWSWRPTVSALLLSATILLLLILGLLLFVTS